MRRPAARGVLAALRRSRAGGAAFFVLLLLLVASERRLAEAQLNARPVTVALESDDVLDGDEVRVRLVVLNDDRAPVIPDVFRVQSAATPTPIVSRAESRALGRPAPRGPPSVSSASS